MPYAVNKGVRLHWQERGQGTPIVLVMGHRYSSAMWYPILDLLAADHRVIWFDNRGTGRTDTAIGFTVDDMVRDILTVMDAAGLTRAHLFGVSMGGGLVLELALRHPERVVSVILGCIGVKTPETPSAPAWARALYFLPSPILKALFPVKVANDGYGSAASPEAVAIDQAALARDRTSIFGVHAQAGAIARYSLTKARAATLAAPALVMHGDEDGVVPFAAGVELAETLPDVEFVRLEGAGHNFIIASPAKSRSAIKAFLDRIDAGGPRPSRGSLAGLAEAYREKTA